jgi:AcrR family transcriptional regulator
MLAAMVFDSDQPRDALAREATRLFAARGYAAVGVQEIAEAAGVTKPTLYHHFGNKVGLLQAILHDELAALAARIAPVAAYRAELDATLAAVAAAYFAHAEQRTAFYRLMLLLWFSPVDSEERSVSASLFQIQQAMLERLFQDAARDHAVLRGRHAALAATFLGTVNTLIGIRLNGRLRLDHPLARRTVHQFLHGALG